MVYAPGMINCKQAASLLIDAQVQIHRVERLEALYSAGDDQVQAILKANPDLRQKAHSVQETYLRHLQETNEYHAAVRQIREKLNPGSHSPSQQSNADDGCDEAKD